MIRTARGLRVVAAATAGLVTAAIGLATAAQAQPAGSNLPVVAWTYTDSAQPTTPSVNPAGDMPVGTFADDAGAEHTRRAYVTYDISGLAGRVPHLVNLYTSETSVQSCAVQAPVEIYRTKPVKPGSTWKKAPAELELVRQVTLGKGIICPGAYVGTDVTAQIEAALARHEKTLTFEVRIAASAEGDTDVARTFRQLTLFVQSNAVPTVSKPSVNYASSTSCGTLAKHPTAIHPQLSVQVADADPGDSHTATFAVWPVDAPDQRTTYSAGVNSTTGLSLLTDYLTGYADGTVLGWQAQAADSQDTSAWSRTCYLTVDKTPPATKPIVYSKTYPPATDGAGSGGEGVPGTFVLDAGGDSDVASFSISDDFSATVVSTVKANHPGGKARVTVTPKYGLSDTLHVTAVDGAGNRGATTDYKYVVRRTGPYATVTVNGVDVPSPVTFTAAAGVTVTSYAYLLENSGQDEVTIPATGNTATASLLFPKAGYYDLRIRAYDGKKLVGDQTQQVDVTDAPVVNSDVFNWDQDQPYGTSGSFTFTPRESGVVAYVYAFDYGDQKRIDAAADGTGVLDWTADTGGYRTLTVSSVRADGTTSASTDYQFIITDDRPTITTDIDTNADPRTDGVGVPFTVYFSSDQPSPFAYVYSVDGGAEQTAPGDWWTSVQVTPTHSGPLTITVRAELGDGTATPARTVTIDVLDAPFVSAASPYGGTPVTGWADKLSFTPGRTDVASYRYTVNGGDTQTVAAGSDGTATAVYTPGDEYLVDLLVSSVGTDGTVSTPRHYWFAPITASVGLSTPYGADTWTGVGVGGDLTFGSTVDKGVTAYLWSVDGGDTTTTPAGDDGTGVAAFRPTHQGDNVFSVQARYEDGTLSPAAEQHVYVGSAPEVIIGDCTAGTPLTFTIHGGLEQVASFHYAVRGDDGIITSGDVDADATATAQVTFTPTAGQITVYATAHAEAGDSGGSVAYGYAYCAG